MFLTILIDRLYQSHYSSCRPLAFLHVRCAGIIASFLAIKILQEEEL